jgi:hypothetical protein
VVSNAPSITVNRFINTIFWCASHLFHASIHRLRGQCSRHPIARGTNFTHTYPQKSVHSSSDDGDVDHDNDSFNSDDDWGTPAPTKRRTPSNYPPSHDGNSGSRIVWTIHPSCMTRVQILSILHGEHIVLPALINVDTSAEVLHPFVQVPCQQSGISRHDQYAGWMKSDPCSFNSNVILNRLIVFLLSIIILDDLKVLQQARLRYTKRCHSRCPRCF